MNTVLIWIPALVLAAGFVVFFSGELSGSLADSAASIISVSRRMSRCIDRPGLGQD